MEIAGTICAALFMLSDSSGSVSHQEYFWQRDQVANDFEMPEIHRTIERRPLAVAYADFSNRVHVHINWRVLHNAEGAQAFAEDIRKTYRVWYNSTHAGGAIQFATAAFDQVPCDAEERTIDIVSDGSSNGEVQPSAARGQAVARGIRINGLAVGEDNRNPGPWVAANLVTPASDTLPAGFMNEAEGWDDFRRAIRAQTSHRTCGMALNRRPSGRACHQVSKGARRLTGRCGMHRGLGPVV